MKARLVSIEQLVGKLTAEVGVLWKENDSIKGTTNKFGTVQNPAIVSMLDLEMLEEKECRRRGEEYVEWAA